MKKIQFFIAALALALSSMSYAENSRWYLSAVGLQIPFGSEDDTLAGGITGGYQQILGDYMSIEGGVGLGIVEGTLPGTTTSIGYGLNLDLDFKFGSISSPFAAYGIIGLSQFETSIDGVDNPDAISGAHFGAGIGFQKKNGEGMYLDLVQVQDSNFEDDKPLLFTFTMTSAF